jgi:chemotaxis protein CheD
LFICVILRTHSLNRFRRVLIDPGEYYAASGAVTISTLLGSCVAACLYDPARQIIGMNHFLLSTRDGDLERQQDAGRYGVHAMELLINSMMAAGADRRTLKAKAFGGADMGSGSRNSVKFLNVGRVNCEFIREFLLAEKIPLVSESLGGTEGRVIHFSNGDFTVYMRRISPDRSAKVAERDHECWLKAIEAQEKSIPNVDLWL